MLYIEQLHGAMVHIEVEIVEYQYEEDYMLTLIDLYRRTLDITVSRVLGELCDCTSLPPEHRFAITHKGEPFANNIVIHSTGIENVYRYSDIISKDIKTLDLEHLPHFNQEVHEFKHFVLRWYEDTLDIVAKRNGLNKMDLGIMCLS